MRTVEQLLEYNITELEEIKLFQCQIINGVGGEGFNLEKVLYEMIKVVKGFDHQKATALLNDIRKLSEEHDIQYRFKMGFYWSNFKFCKKLFHLLHWNKKRLAIAVGTYIILNKYGKDFYNSKKSV